MCWSYRRSRPRRSARAQWRGHRWRTQQIINATIDAAVLEPYAWRTSFVSVGPRVYGKGATARRSDFRAHAHDNMFMQRMRYSTRSQYGRGPKCLASMSMKLAHLRRKVAVGRINGVDRAIAGRIVRADHLQAFLLQSGPTMKVGSSAIPCPSAAAQCSMSPLLEDIGPVTRTLCSPSGPCSFQSCCAALP